MITLKDINRTGSLSPSLSLPIPVLLYFVFFFYSRKPRRLLQKGHAQIQLINFFFFLSFFFFHKSRFLVIMEGCGMRNNGERRRRGVKFSSGHHRRNVVVGSKLKEFKASPDPRYSTFGKQTWEVSMRSTLCVPTTIKPPFQ